jgi:hypothetical protein
MKKIIMALLAVGTISTAIANQANFSGVIGYQEGKATLYIQGEAGKILFKSLNAAETVSTFQSLNTFNRKGRDYNCDKSVDTRDGSINYTCSLTVNNTQEGEIN